MSIYSVIIPTLNEEKVIQRCLDAIHAGLELPDEIIVVDGNSTDHTREIAYGAGAQVFLNSQVNAASGRNIGLANSHGNVIVFTDADCVPDKNWLAEIKRTFENNNSIDGIGGPLVALPPHNKIESFWGKTFLNEIMPSPKTPTQIKHRVMNGAFVTANCAYRRKILLEVNGFDEWFGNQAEDVDLFWRAIDHNATLFFLPSVIVYHSFPDTLNGMMKKNFRNGMSSSRLQKRYGSKINFDKNLYKVLANNFCKLINIKLDGFYGCLQIISHLAGKIIGSVKFKVINL